MIGLIPHVPGVMEFVILLGSFLVACGLVYKYVVKPVKAVFSKWNSAMDTLVGYPPVLDPGSGKELKPATPALANRVEVVEDAIVSLIATTNKLAELERDLASISVQLQERERAGMQIVEEWTDWRNVHEMEAQAREKRLEEWEQWRQEQTLLVNLIKNHQDSKDLS